MSIDQSLKYNLKAGYITTHLWHPAGMQLVVDELLHTLNPLLVIVYWWLYEKKTAVRYGQIILWLIYPLAYLAYVLIRGGLSGFYPYPFIDVSKIGLKQAFVNSGVITLIFIIVGSAFILIGKKTEKGRV